MNFLEVGKREIAMSTKVIELVGGKKKRISNRDARSESGRWTGLGTWGGSDYEKVYQDWVRMMQVSETGL